MKEVVSVREFVCEYCGKAYSVDKCLGKEELAKKGCMLHEKGHEDSLRKAYLTFVEKLRREFPNWNFYNTDQDDFNADLVYSKYPGRDSYDAGVVNIAFSAFIIFGKKYEKEILMKIQSKNAFFTGLKSAQLEFCDGLEYGTHEITILVDDEYICDGHNIYFENVCRELIRLGKALKIIVVEESGY